MNVIKIFTDLVQIDSPSGEEQDVADYIISFLKKLGISAKKDKSGNIYALSKGTGEPLLLCAHMDTVEPGRGIEPVIKNGVIKSKGDTILGADNKIALAVILHTVEKLHKQKHRPIEMVFSVREETDGGINEFDMSKIKSKYGLIADRGREIGGIVLASPWIVNVTVEIVGKSAHAGNPEEGINALSAAASAIDACFWGRVDDVTTANIGLISGGSAMNTIPEKISLIGEVRSYKKTHLDKTLQKIKTAFTQLEKTHKVKVDFKSELYCSGYVYKENSLAVKKAADALMKAGITPTYDTSFGGSDANTFIAKKIYAVNISDGGMYPHTVDESVKVKDLEKLCEIVTHYITA